MFFSFRCSCSYFVMHPLPRLSSKSDKRSYAPLQHSFLLRADSSLLGTFSWKQPSKTMQEFKRRGMWASWSDVLPPGARKRQSQ
jgi:hypothetical protein